MFAVVLAVTVHEFAHAKSAQVAGDDTAARMGRVSLNPLDHLDPLGTLMMIVTALTGLGLGWGKPVPVNHFRLRHPRWDSVKVSLWGPLSNVLTALVLGTLLRFLPPVLGPWAELLAFCVLVNLSLAVFNMIPLPPLDGSHILSGLLPAEQARQYAGFVGRYGPILLLVLVLAPGHPLRHIIAPPVVFLSQLFVG